MYNSKTSKFQRDPRIIDIFNSMKYVIIGKENIFVLHLNRIEI